MPLRSPPPKRSDGRIILHFDYDAFYASTFEREDPRLQYLPLAVQQKQIVVTCNYEARRRGLHKLQLVKEAKRVCPDVVIVLGEDLTRFRNASKELYAFLRAYAWSSKVERLGFDEVFIDVTDIINYNMDLLNYRDLATSFFHLDRNDPLIGFTFDASRVMGNIFPKKSEMIVSSPALSAASPQHDKSATLFLRLLLGSHLALHLRHQLEEQKGYSSTVGISTNKLISKLVGNLNKPKGQTTLMPPYSCAQGGIQSSITQFIDSHDIGKIPGIGIKLAQKIRDHVLGRPATINEGHIYGRTTELVTVKEVRLRPDMGPDLLDSILGGPGVLRDIGDSIWGLINGVDHSEVSQAKTIPQQISIEDSYLRLDVIEDVKKELLVLTRSLIRRMHLDLMSDMDATNDFGSVREMSTTNQTPISSSQWLAHPRTLRLTTRPRLPLNPDKTHPRAFTRISKSCNMPTLVFSKSHSVESIAEKLVDEALIPLFRKLHPELSGWNLSLINVCATNMSELATGGVGRDISRMFKSQDNVLKEWRVRDVDASPSESDTESQQTRKIGYVIGASQVATNKFQDDRFLGSEDKHTATQETLIDDDSAWDNEIIIQDFGEACTLCGAIMPAFAMVAHERFHSLPD